MKRFLNYYLSMTLIASLFVVTSCGEEDDPLVIDGPTVTLGNLTDDAMTVDVGEDVEFDVNVTAPAGFNRLVIYATVEDGTRQTLLDSARASGTAPTTFTYPFSWTPTANEAGKDVTFEFFAVDEEDKDQTNTLVVSVNEVQVNAYNTVLLLAPTASQENEVWFSTSTGEKYSTKEVNDTEEALSAQIDFGYRYGPTAKATLASPATYPSEGAQNTSGWGAKNETMLKKIESNVSETAFVEMGNSIEALESAYLDETAEGAGRLTDLKVGDVLAFMTDASKPGEAGGKYGLIHVEAINMGTDGTGFGEDASIAITVKVQP